jgi:hypothetical protein
MFNHRIVHSFMNKKKSKSHLKIFRPVFKVELSEIEKKSFFFRSIPGLTLRYKSV